MSPWTWAWLALVFALVVPHFAGPYAMWRHRRRMAKWNAERAEVDQRRLFKQGTRFVDTTIRMGP